MWWPSTPVRNDHEQSRVSQARDSTSYPPAAPVARPGRSRRGRQLTEPESPNAAAGTLPHSGRIPSHDTFPGIATPQPVDVRVETARAFLPVA